MRIVVHVGAQTHEVQYKPRGINKSHATRDASLRAMYDDLASRMMLALRYTMQQATSDHRGYGGLQHVSAWLEEAQYISPAAWAILQEAKTRDDVQGHAFHGNQHTGGINGPHKPKHAHIHEVQMGMAHGDIKGAKQAVHKLLSSGHPWTKEELALAVGMDPKGKTINDYLTNLKNPKFAGPQGALKIEKNKEGHFYVALPDGQPAPPPDTKWTAAKIDAHEDMNDLTEYMHKVPDVPNNPDGTINWGAQFEAIKTPDVPVAHEPKPEPFADFEKMKGAQPGSMLKTLADEHYKKHIDESYASLKNNLANGVDPHIALVAFKSLKGAGMAAWATAVHGHPFKNTASSTVFKADEQLAKDVKDFSQEAALNNWKANTAAEKLGNFPPKVTPSANVTMTPAAPKVSPHAPVMIADMGHPAPVKPLDYSTLSKVEGQVSTGDITAEKFSKGIEMTKQMFNAEAQAQASIQKKEVEHTLRERLKDKPNFQALVKRLGLAKEGFGSLEARLVGAWAGSSGDTHDISVALQMAVRDAFSIPDKHIEKKALKSLQNHEDLDALTSSGIHSLNPNMTPLKPHEAATARAALQEFVQAQYHATQDHLTEQGLSHVYLARGMHLKANHENNKVGSSKLKLQPASSFSVDYGTAKSFAGSGGTVFMVRVPKEQVLSTYLTGFGCMSEHEVVVLAHEHTRAYTVPGTVYGSSAAQTYLKAHIEGKEAYA